MSERLKDLVVDKRVLVVDGRTEEIVDHAVITSASDCTNIDHIEVRSTQLFPGKVVGLVFLDYDGLVPGWRILSCEYGPDTLVYSERPDAPFYQVRPA